MGQIRSTSSKCGHIGPTKANFAQSWLKLYNLAKHRPKLAIIGLVAAELDHWEAPGDVAWEYLPEVYLGGAPESRPKSAANVVGKAI